METEKIIYGFNASDLATCKIFPCKVIKETSKTYIVSYKRVDWDSMTTTRTVKKSVMQAYNTIFTETYEQALEALKQAITRTIESRARQVIYLNSQNEKLAARLKELQAGGGNNDS